MGEVLLVLLLACVAVLAAMGLAMWAVVHALVVRNRVVPGRGSPAPLSWLAAPDHAARLHRRLRAACALAGAAAGPTGDDLGLVDIVERLRDRAVELDVHLVIASHAPKTQRRRMLRELQSEVGELEQLAERTVRMSRAWTGSTPNDRSLSAVRERLELLEVSLRELDGLEVGRPTPSLENRTTRRPGPQA